MRHPNFVILYVEDPTVSVGFYINLFNQQPVESAPTFALFVLNSGLKFGLADLATSAFLHSQRLWVITAGCAALKMSIKDGLSI